MHGLTVGAAMGLVNTAACSQCKAIKSENNAISRRLHSSCRSRREFLEPLVSTQPFASHTNCQISYALQGVSQQVREI